MAETPSQRRQGLRHVERLGGIDGMLFVYSNPSSTAYGMRDTLIPLDIWWFDSGGYLLGSAEMEPCDTVECTSYGSPGMIMWVLETPMGEYEFAVGSRLSGIESR